HLYTYCTVSIAALFLVCLGYYISQVHFLSFPPITSHMIIIFFFNVTPSTEIYTLSLHDALPISSSRRCSRGWTIKYAGMWSPPRSEEHTSELQSRENLVCRLLLEKKNKKNK